MWAFFLTLHNMNIILFDSNREVFFPLSYTRPVSNFRVGILTIKEKWEQYCKSVSVQSADYLLAKFPLKVEKDNIWVDSRFFPNESLITELRNLRFGELLEKNGEKIAFRSSVFNASKLNKINSHAELNYLNNICDIFSINGRELITDFTLITKDRKSQPIHKSNTSLGNNIFIDDGAKVRCSILNAEDGPIYIGKNCQVMEGSIIRGPFSMCENAVVKMGAKIYGSTTLGRYCKVGGEVNNTVFFDYSSKAHDGFIGNSVIGSWCNLGADTNCSNLKNNYSKVKLWNYEIERFKETGLQFCGLIMGDHSKCGINTMFNTGTVIGVSSNIYGSGFVRNFIPSFSWGGSAGFSLYKLQKVFDVAEKVFSRRDLIFDSLEKRILEEVYSATKRYRNEL